LILLAKKVQASLDVRKISEPYLKELAQFTKSAAFLGIISKD